MGTVSGESSSLKEPKLPERQRHMVERSYEDVKAVAIELKDPAFLKSGLTGIVSKDGSKEYVLNDPVVKALFEKEGAECLGLSSDHFREKEFYLNEVLVEGRLKK